MTFFSSIVGYKLFQTKKDQNYIRFSVPWNLPGQVGQVYLTVTCEAGTFGGVLPKIGDRVVLSLDGYGRCTSVVPADKYLADVSAPAGREVKHG